MEFGVEGGHSEKLTTTRADAEEGGAISSGVLRWVLTEKDGGEEEYSFGRIDVEIHGENGCEEDAAAAVRKRSRQSI
jgi:hypothetical protein